MHKVEPIKRLLEKSTGFGIPDKAEALSRVQPVKSRRLKFRADGYIPNNPSLPLLYYRNAVGFERGGDPAALLEAIFNVNGWGDAWRNGVYDFVHYHPRIDEVLGIARGIRAVEQLRLVMGEPKMADVRAQVALSLFTDFENFTTFIGSRPAKPGATSRPPITRFAASSKRGNRQREFDSALGENPILMCLVTCSGRSPFNSAQPIVIIQK